MDDLREIFISMFTFEEPGSTVWRIKVDGKYIKVGRNKKTSWKRLGDAKNALACHFKCTVCRTVYGIERGNPSQSRYYSGFSSKEEDRVWKEFLEWAQNTKFIEFVEV